jgi:Fe2+ or Zn2+ uptake regulation protein
VENYLAILKDNGYKLTSNRKHVLEILLRNKRPLTLNDIKQLCKNVDFATVYRIIGLYLSLNIVDEIKLLEKQIHYELMGADHHHHIICSKCGKIERIDLCIIDQAKKLTKYKITYHTLEFKGLCPACKKN